MINLLLVFADKTCYLKVTLSAKQSAKAVIQSCPLMYFDDIVFLYSDDIYLAA